MHTITYTYYGDDSDYSGRLWKVEEPGLKMTEYDYYLDGSVKIKQGDKLTTYYFDDHGRLERKDVWQESGDTEHAQGSRTLSWHYAYDDHGNTASVTDPAGKTEHFDYDANGNLVSAKTYAKKVDSPNATRERLIDVTIWTEDKRKGVNPGRSLQLGGIIEETLGSENVVVLDEPIIWSAERGSVDTHGHFTAPTEPGQVKVSGRATLDHKASHPLTLDVADVTGVIEVGEVERDEHSRYGPILRNPGQALTLDAQIEHDFEDVSVRWEASAHEQALIVDPGNPLSATFTPPAGAGDVVVRLYTNLDTQANPLLAEEVVRTREVTLDVAGATATSSTRDTTRNLELQVQDGLFSTTVNTNEVVTFEVDVSNDFQASGELVWEHEAGPGRLSDAGEYTPPTSLTNGDTTTLRVSSSADMTQTALIEVKLSDISVEIDRDQVRLIDPDGTDTPPSRLVSASAAAPHLALHNQQEVELTAFAANDLQADGAVAWSIDEEATTAAKFGTVQSGHYYPSNDTDGHVVVVATSVADGRRADTITLDVGPLSVSMSDDETFVFSNQKVELTNDEVVLERDFNCDGVIWSPRERGQWAFPTMVCPADPDRPYTAETQPTTEFTPDDIAESVTLRAESRRVEGEFDELDVHVRQLDLDLDLPAAANHPSVKTLGDPLQINNNEALPLTAVLNLIKGESDNGPVDIDLGDVEWNVSSPDMSNADRGEVISDTGGLNATYLNQNGQGTVTVTASSTKDDRRSASATFMVTPIEVSIVEPARQTLAPDESVQLEATLSNDFRGLGVAWSADGGVISDTGLLTPSVGGVYTNNTVTVTATSVADPQRSATETFSIPVAIRDITAPRDYVNPASGDSLILSAQLSNDLAEQGVTWEVLERIDARDQPIDEKTLLNSELLDEIDILDPYRVRYTPPTGLQNGTKITLRALSTRQFYKKEFSLKNV